LLGIYPSTQILICRDNTGQPDNINKHNSVYINILITKSGLISSPTLTPQCFSVTYLHNIEGKVNGCFKHFRMLIYKNFMRKDKRIKFFGQFFIFMIKVV